MVKNPNILVVGDLMIDDYLKGSCERISPEAPVQVVDIKSQKSVLGGAGNVVNNLRALGCKVSVVSVLGDDREADNIFKMLDHIGADSSFVVQEKGRATTKKTRILASSQQILRFDNETKEPISAQSCRVILDFLKQNIEDFDLVLLSDYGKGVLEDTLTKDIINLANRYDKFILVDPKGKDYSKYKNATLLTPNKKEAALATGIEINSNEALLEALKKLKEISNLKYSIITISEDGVSLLDNGLKIFPTTVREVFDVTGAGDTVLASLGYQLALKNSIAEAIKFANLAAGVVVGKVGSATATLAEIEEFKSSLHKSSLYDKIVDAQTAANRAYLFSKNGKKVVFTNGCFDILHRGHVEYLQKARSFGDILILGLNSDSSVRRLKGESRPINNQDDRACVLSALEFIDYIVIFDEETPYELISLIKPDILVKGGDYKGKVVVGSDVAKEVKLIDFVDGKSTTNIIQKIQTEKLL